jgi:hypothetical protein
MLSGPLSRNVKIQNSGLLVLDIKRGAHTECVWKQFAEGNIRPKTGEWEKLHNEPKSSMVWVGRVSLMGEKRKPEGRRPTERPRC